MNQLFWEDVCEYSSIIIKDTFQSQYYSYKSKAFKKLNQPCLLFRVPKYTVRRGHPNYRKIPFALEQDH